MSYQFKGINIENIIDTVYSPTSSVFNNVYTGLPTSTPPNYNNSYLLYNLGFSYTNPNTGITNDLATVCSAIHVNYASSQGVYVPTGANQLRYFIIGGSGGGGGGAGVANNSSVQGNGGSGGNGGVGPTADGNISDLTNINYLSINIGNGGGGGGQGQWSSNNDSGTTSVSGPGSAGGNGNTTAITGYDSNWNVNASFNAAGGSGGGGGGVGSAYWSTYYPNSSYPGNNGASYPNNYTTNTWNPNYVTSQAGGGGGAGGTNKYSNGNPGGAGQNGYAVIVWLYGSDGSTSGGQTPIGQTPIYAGYELIPGQNIGGYSVTTGGQYVYSYGYCLVLEKNGSLRLIEGNSPVGQNIVWSFESGNSDGTTTAQWDQNQGVNGAFTIVYNNQIIWDAPQFPANATIFMGGALISQGGVVSLRTDGNIFVWQAQAGDGPNGEQVPYNN